MTDLSCGAVNWPQIPQNFRRNYVFLIRDEAQ